MENEIAILLATFNGGKYIKVQLDSIVNQTYRNWKLLISDDGSKDNTISIINEYCAKDSRIHLLNQEVINKGASQNFGNLIIEALVTECDFIMFSDQDDYWKEDKIQITLESMLSGLESEKMPKLIYTDFEYADHQLAPLRIETDKNTSAWRDPNLQRLLAENNIYGCTMMINRSLAEKACPIPDCAENHDYWIALVAATFGSIKHVKKRTILYRQHSNNVSGHYLDNSFKARFQRYYKKNEWLEKILKGRFQMAESLLNRFEGEVSTKIKNLLVGYSNFENMKGSERVFFCLKNGIQKNNFGHSLAFYFSLLRF